MKILVADEKLEVNVLPTPGTIAGGVEVGKIRNNWKHLEVKVLPASGPIYEAGKIPKAKI